MWYSLDSTYMEYRSSVPLASPYSFFKPFSVGQTHRGLYIKTFYICIQPDYQDLLLESRDTFWSWSQLLCYFQWEHSAEQLVLLMFLIFCSSPRQDPLTEGKETKKKSFLSEKYIDIQRQKRRFCILRCQELEEGRKIDNKNIPENS